MQKLKKVLLWIWQLPQHIVALIINLYLIITKTGCRVNKDDEFIYLKWGADGSMSLGKYIFICSLEDKDTIKHECNHTRQSKVLGPLYLLIIGLPSLIHCCIWLISYYTTGNAWDYYSFYTEHWMFKD